MISKMWNVNVVLLLAPALMCSIVNSLQFEVKPSHPICFSEDIKANSITVGNYHVINPNQAGYPMPDSHKITARVRSPSGNGFHYGNSVFSGDFSFTTDEAGDYTACFSVLTADVTVDFAWKTGVAAKDLSNNIAKKDQIEDMEWELKKLYDTVTSIHEEMFHLREREAEMQVINDGTNSKMFNYSFISILVCLSVAGLQIWHLKSFFEKKKLV